ncbi:hypothetical protein ACO1O0_007396 [Amphichorda felina]
MEGGDQNGGHNTGDHTDSPQDDYPPTYFSHPGYAGLMYAHIGLMVVAWVFVLPVVNALGVLLGTIYNAQTPDLYPGNAHHSIGWIITWVASAHMLISLVGRVAGAIKASNRGSSQEEHRFIPVSPDMGDSNRYRFAHGYRLSDETVHGSGPATESLRSNSVSTHVADDEDLSISRHAKDYEDDEPELEDMTFSNPKPRSALMEKLARAISGRIWKYLNLGYKIVDRIILPFGFIAFTTGVVAYGRLFEGRAIFGGLAHWIKGGIFFWLGLFNLGRWTGSFAELGWAWNIRPKQSRRTWRPSAEFVESALIFMYGSTNIFLEHLGNWGKKWRAQDLEHISITVLFIGGGLSSDTVEGMIHYELDAMFMYTVTMGMVGMLMAWEVVVLAIKGWAVRKERQAKTHQLAQTM